jgi:hypothetical protein
MDENADKIRAAQGFLHLFPRELSSREINEILDLTPPEPAPTAEKQESDHLLVGATA